MKKKQFSKLKLHSFRFGASNEMSKEEFSGLLTKINAEFDQLDTFIE